MLPGTSALPCLEYLTFDFATLDLGGVEGGSVGHCSGEASESSPPVTQVPNYVTGIIKLGHNLYLFTM